ncbi:NAC domain-containing protein JA2-like [Elaeis guineensis]|uniref:NAC domain-containing protein JA2-like n=1 Tax=Elaeis guineensis var. tenera TaxID=51953 RepID=UPI003C6D4538
MVVPVVADLTGWTFDLDDEELIEHYLVPKVRGEQKSHLCFIPELDVYATEPWNLGLEFRHGKHRDAFFCFTRVARSVASNGRLQRGAGNGTWHAGGRRTLVRCNGEVSGQKMSNLKFMLRAKKGGKAVATSWIMHEYRLFKPAIDDQGKEMVLYRIQKSRTGLSDDHQCLDDDFSVSMANQQRGSGKEPKCRHRASLIMSNGWGVPTCPSGRIQAIRRSTN